MGSLEVHASDLYVAGRDLRKKGKESCRRWVRMGGIKTNDPCEVAPPRESGVEKEGGAPDPKTFGRRNRGKGSKSRDRLKGEKEQAIRE